MGQNYQYHGYLAVEWAPSGARVELGASVIRLRYADASDVDAMASIELVSQPDPWNDEMFARELGLAWSHTWIVEDASGKSNAVLGFLVFWIVEGEAHVLSVSVAPAARRKGVAQYLISAFAQACVARGVGAVSLEVRAGNVAARALYTGLGFKRVGRRKRYYSDNGEDALVLCWELGLELE